MSLLPQTCCGIFSFFKGVSKNRKSKILYCNLHSSLFQSWLAVLETPVQTLFWKRRWKTGCWHFSKHFIWVVAYGTVKMGWLEPIFGISYLNIWHFALTHLIKKNNFKSPLFLVFLSLQTWEVAISEMGSLGPILDSKLIPLVPFYTGAIAGQMNYYWSTPRIRQNNVHKKGFISFLK